MTETMVPKNEKPDYSERLRKNMGFDLFEQEWVTEIAWSFFGNPDSLSARHSLYLCPIADAMDVAAWGATKYGEIGGWRKIPDGYRVFRAAASRHLKAELDSPGSLDEESGKPHTAHFLANVLFALWHLENHSLDTVMRATTAADADTAK